MITAEFFRSGDNICGFRVSGHAEYDDPGRDIVCAAVSSAVQLTANLITEMFCFDADVTAENDTVMVKMNLEDCKAPEIVRIIGGFQLHIQLLSEEFEGTIKIVYTEV